MGMATQLRLVIFYACCGNWRVGGKFWKFISGIKYENFLLFPLFSFKIFLLYIFPPYDLCYCLLQRHLQYCIGTYLDPLAGEAAAGDGGAAPEGLELGVGNISVVINLILTLFKKNFPPFPLFSLHSLLGEKSKIYIPGWMESLILKWSCSILVFHDNSTFTI